MNRSLLTPVLAALLSGCANTSGVWVLNFPYQEEGSECASTVDENFTDGHVPADDAPTTDEDWAFTSMYEGGDVLAFAQIETTADGEAILVFAGEAYPGVKEEGAWVFEWVDDVEQAESMEHASGYAYVEGSVAQSSTRITFTPEGLTGQKAGGELTMESTDASTWTESDEWSEDLAYEIGDRGQIPSSSYLVYEDGQGTRAQYNEYDARDCDGDCTLSITTTCSGTGAFSATRADFADEDAYDYLQGVGNGS